jgi:putative endonuclease
VGLTDSLNKRLQEHREGLVDAFTRKCKIHPLMYYEVFRDAKNADFREKQIKKWRREKKIGLFALSNPKWTDLTETSSWLNKDFLM